MDISNLKCVVGKVEPDQPAVIRFFGEVDEYNTRCFNEEFLWLQNAVKPSKIVVLINSEGGSVLYGMSTYSVISGCPYRVDCVIEGMAASMGSVIWAAGDNLYMHDYSILMIHNPFSQYSGDSENTKAMVEAFKQQLCTIYQNRFCMDKEKVCGIMEGEGEVDGTYFDATAAVEAGILPKDNVLSSCKETNAKCNDPQAGCKKTCAALSFGEMREMRERFTAMAASIDLDKLVNATESIHLQKPNSKIQNKPQSMEKETTFFGTVAAQLGFPADTEIVSVSSRITELLNAEKALVDAQAKLAELTAVKDDLNAVNIQLAGKTAEVENLNAELASAKAELNAYHEAERQAREAEIEAMVNAAIAAGKIDASAKENWVAMAQSNMEMVKATLDSIQAREVISAQISQDPNNIQDVKDALKTAEQKMAEQVEQVVGKFEFKKF